MTASFTHSPSHHHSWPAALLISLCSMATPLVHYSCFALTKKGVCISNSSRCPATRVYFKSLFFILCRRLGLGDIGNGRPGNKGRVKSCFSIPTASLNLDNWRQHPEASRIRISFPRSFATNCSSNQPAQRKWLFISTEAKTGNRNIKRSRMQPSSRWELLLPFPLRTLKQILSSHC